MCTRALLNKDWRLFLLSSIFDGMYVTLLLIHLLGPLLSLESKKLYARQAVIWSHTHTSASDIKHKHTMSISRCVGRRSSLQVCPQLSTRSCLYVCVWVAQCHFSALCVAQKNSTSNRERQKACLTSSPLLRCFLLKRVCSRMQSSVKINVGDGRTTSVFRASPLSFHILCLAACCLVREMSLSRLFLLLCCILIWSVCSS